MSYVIKAVLSNPRRPECGQITIPFPIPADQYDQTIEMLQEMDLGYSVNRECRVDEVDSHYRVLGAINGTLVNVNQLDYLAKRLDSFCVGEDEQFQAMAWKLKLTDIKDLINLTFCSQRATVITDFSDLEAVGRSHFINLNGGGARMEELENLDGIETALLLIDSGGETVTPYGVVYDNGMKLEQVYNGYLWPGTILSNVFPAAFYLWLIGFLYLSILLLGCVVFKQTFTSILFTGGIVAVISLLGIVEPLAKFNPFLLTSKNVELISGAVSVSELFVPAIISVAITVAGLWSSILLFDRKQL